MKRITLIALVMVVAIIVGIENSFSATINVVTDYNAAGDGIIDDTDEIEAALNAAEAGDTIVFPQGTYITEAWPATATSLRLVGYGAKLLRKSTAGGALVTLSTNSIMEGFEIDGDKDTLGGGKGDIGVSAGDGALIKNMNVHDCAGAGVKVLNDDAANPTIVNNVTSHNNGLTPGANGTGDGIYVQNSFNTKIINCNTKAENARRLVEHLMDENIFFTKMPIPTVSPSEECFEKDMWRGPAWLNCNYIILEGLYKYGFIMEAESIKTRVIAEVTRWYFITGCLMEYYDSECLEDPRYMQRKQSRTKGIRVVRDYGWSAAMFIAISNFEKNLIRS